MSPEKVPVNNVSFFENPMDRTVCTSPVRERGERERGGKERERGKWKKDGRRVKIKKTKAYTFLSKHSFLSSEGIATECPKLYMLHPTTNQLV